jgi:hypothetical protein
MLKPHYLPQNFDSFGQALKEAERLKQQAFYRLESHHYMVTSAEKGYLVDLFSWASRDAALENQTLLIVI